MVEIFDKADTPKTVVVFGFSKHLIDFLLWKVVLDRLSSTSSHYRVINRRFQKFSHSLEQVRWREGLQCPRCRSSSVIKYGSYRAFQRYLCKDCDRTFDDKTRTIFAHAKIALNEWLFAIYAFVRFNTSIRQLTAELNLSYKTLHRRVERFAKALDAPSIKLRGPVEIDELYVSAGQKGRERDG